VRIDSVTLSGFRSFGPKPVIVDFANDLTAIVGPNASGKTALLQGSGRVRANLPGWSGMASAIRSPPAGGGLNAVYEVRLVGGFGAA
jgi:AAA domain